MVNLLKTTSRLCRLMCGRSLTFRQDIRESYRGYALSSGVAPKEEGTSERWGEATNAHQRAEPPMNKPGSARLARWGSLTAFMLIVVTLIIAFIFNSRVSAKSTAEFPSPLDSDLVDPQEPTGDFSKFTHTNPMHSRLPCLLCHRRETNSPRPSRPGKGGHLPCAGCHSQQFTNAGSPICTICHTDVQKGALKPFPPLRSFRVKFEHARHVGKTSVSCATCHRPLSGGVALSIPARSNGHVVCYQCHTPRAQSNGRDISSCGTCHQLGGYSRTPALAPAFKVSFSHAKHGTPQKLSCSDCHNVRAGMPQRRQVSAPVPLNHHAPAGAESCMTCHNGKRAFGGDDFTSCKRCHQGPQWHF